MKKINKILVLTAIVASFTLANRASAGDTLLSPRAEEQQRRVVPGTNTDPDLAHGVVLAPKVVAKRSPIIVGNSKNDPNLVHQYASTPGTPKQQDQQPMQFQIAPSK